MFKYQNRGISTLVAIGIIAVLIVVVGGGIFAYQYFTSKIGNSSIPSATTAGILYINKIEGYQIKLPSDWTNYKVVDGKFLLPTSDKTWHETIGGKDTYGYASVFLITKYSMNDWNKMKESCGISGGQNWDRGCYEDNGEYTLGRTNTTVFVLDGPNAGPDDTQFATFRKEVMTANYLKNNFSIISAVTITSPISSSSYNAGDIINVKWIPISFPVIEIAIIPENMSNNDGTNKAVWGGYGGELEKVAPITSGEYKITIPKQIPDDNYKIRIISDYNRYTETSYFSEVFHIKNSTNQTIVQLSLWPNVNSFDLTNKTFEAKGVRDSASIKDIKVYTNNSTKISSQNMSTSIYDFQGLYSMVKNWVGPEWWFTTKGVMQKDGSIVASEISIAGQ